MTTTREIVDRATDLAAALGRLVANDTAPALRNAAREVGAADALQEGAALLVAALDAVLVELGELDGVMAQMAGARGLVGLLEPVLGALGAMTSETAEHARAYGLDPEIASAIEQGTRYVSSAIGAVDALLIEPQGFQALIAQLKGFSTELQALFLNPPQQASA